MAGKEQHLRIRLTELRRRELPELDDELAKGVGDFETLDALRTRIRQDLAAEGERRGEEQVRAELIREIVEANPFDVPVSMVERYLDFMLGMDPERAEEQRRQQTPEQAERFSQMRAVFRPQAEAALKRMLVVESLADREGLRATADEVDERVEKLAEQHGVSPSDAWLQLEKNGQLQSLENEITEEKVFAFLKSRNSVA
jgi:trigger factor